MTQATVGESCKGLHNALTNSIARRLPLGIARPLRIVRVRTYQMRNGQRTPSGPSARALTIVIWGHPHVTAWTTNVDLIGRCLVWFPVRGWFDTRRMGHPTDWSPRRPGGIQSASSGPPMFLL